MGEVSVSGWTLVCRDFLLVSFGRLIKAGKQRGLGLRLPPLTSALIHVHFADDIFLFGCCEEDIRVMIFDITIMLRQAGLEINGAKTSFICSAMRGEAMAASWHLLQLFHANNHKIKANIQKKTRKNKQQIANSQEFLSFFLFFPFVLIFGLSYQLSLLSYRVFLPVFESATDRTDFFLPRTDFFLPVPTFWGQVPSLGGFILIFPLEFLFAFSVFSVCIFGMFRLSFSVFPL